MESHATAPQEAALLVAGIAPLDELYGLVKERWPGFGAPSTGRPVAAATATCIKSIVFETPPVPPKTHAVPAVTCLPST